MLRLTGSSQLWLRTFVVTLCVAGMLAIPSSGVVASGDGPIEQPPPDSLVAATTTVATPEGLVEIGLQAMPAVEGDWLTFVLTISGAFSDPISTVMFTAGKGEDFGGSATATSNVDYGYTRRSHTFYGPGQFAIDVPSYDDNEVEGDEWFKVIAGNTGAFPPVTFDLRVEGWIIDNDTAATPMLAFDDVDVTEGDTGTSTANFTLSLQPAAPTAVEIEYSTCGAGCHDDATAASGEDYLLARETLTFAPGETAKTIPVTILGDTEVEDDEFFFIGLLDVVGAGVEDAVGVGTILNDDTSAPSSLSVNDISVSEGDSGTTEATFTVSLSPAAAATVTVDYVTCGVGCGGDAEFGVDYQATSGTLTFNPGDLAKNVAVEVIGDTDVEGDETFYLLIENADGATIGDDRGRATILNDDTAGTSSLSVNDVTQLEGDTGTKTANFIITLSPASSATVEVEYSTCGVGCSDTATATKGEDYVFARDTVTFAPGETSRTVPISIIGDTDVEDDEIFYLSLLNPINATIAHSPGLGTIRNDDSGGGGTPPLCNGLQATIWGNGLLQGTAGNDVIVGGPGSDEIRGNDGDDVLCGLGGDDTIIGGRGNDQMWGGPGNDLIKGLPGNDTAYGGPGDDRLQGNAGNDVLEGDDGKDRMWGGIGPDTMSGGAGNDHLHGGPGGDVLIGGPDTDRIWGDADDDSILGNGRSDFLYGGIGTDVIEGGPGNDRLFGWYGDDFLYGNEGRDQLRGQDGDDLVDGGPQYDFCSVETVELNCEKAI